MQDGKGKTGHEEHFISVRHRRRAEAFFFDGEHGTKRSREPHVDQVSDLASHESGIAHEYPIIVLDDEARAIKRKRNNAEEDGACLEKDLNRRPEDGCFGSEKRNGEMAEKGSE